MEALKGKISYILFGLGILILLVPVFSMGYLFSLDNPAHFYNALIFNDLIFGGDSDFYSEYFSINSEFTPNLIGLIWVGVLLKTFPTIIAIKVFNISFIVLLSGSIYYFLKGIMNKKPIPLSIVLILPFVTSAFVVYGFVNFYLSFIFLFFTLGKYVRIKNFNWKNTLLLTALILLTYLGHSIVFGFLLLLIGTFEFTKHILVSYEPKLFLKAFLRSLLIAFPPIILTLLFLGARESEVSYLPFSELTYNLFTMKSLRLFDAQGVLFNSFFATFLLVMVVLLVFLRLKKLKKLKQSDFLLIGSVLFLICYFVLPDSVGFASVFSVRISYFFWIALVLWILIEISYFKIISIGMVSCSFVLLIWNMTVFNSEYEKLNQSGKEVISSSKYIENESVVYPVFASNVWNHFHFSNLLGINKSLLILENTCARQDYFPVQYKNKYEVCLQESQNLVYICNAQQVKIDYIFILGNGSIDNLMDQKLIQEAENLGSEIVYETEFIKIYKIVTP